MSPSTPRTTGRRLVELHIVRSLTIINSRSQANGEKIPSDQPAMDKMFNPGEILPPGIDPAILNHLTNIGLVTRVVVRI